MIFIGSPLKGSTMRDQINDDLKGIIPAFNRFIHFHDQGAIKDSEFISHFMESGL